MSTVKDNILFIQQQCKNYSHVSAEGLMYGIANILTMKREILDILLEQSGYDHAAISEEERGKALDILHNKELDPALIKTGAALILPFYQGADDSAFCQQLMQMEDTSGLEAIVSYVIAHLDSGYAEAFRTGNTIENVLDYQKQCKDRCQEPHQEQDQEQGQEQRQKGTRTITVDDAENSHRANRQEARGESYWKDRHSRLVHDLTTHHMEGRQAASIAERIWEFAEGLIGSEYEYLLEDLYDSLRAVEGISRLESTYKAFHKDDSKEYESRYKAAGHQVVRNLWLCLERSKKAYFTARDRFLYLSGKYANVYEQLIGKVVGQDYAVHEFVQACFDAELYENDPNHPQAAFLFAGPPGVGKTFLARSVAEVLGRPFMIYDMTSYSMSQSDLALLGVEVGFKSAHEGTLVSFVEDHPDAIILFDEIEKAHPDVTRLFLQVLEGARLENKFLASNTDFSNTILIFTTNAGRAIYENNTRNLSATPTDVIIKELGKEKSADSSRPKFPPELCSRLAAQHIVMFNHIGVSNMVSLIVHNMDEACKSIEDSLQIRVEYDHRLALLLFMHYGNIDARMLTGQARQFIKKEIYELSRQLAGMDGVRGIRKIEFSIDDSRITDKARRFFSLEGSEAAIAVVCDDQTRKQLEEAQLKGIRIHFIESEERLLECDPEEMTLFLVDPYYEMRKVDRNILGLDDYDSVGLRILKTLLQKNLSAPIYLLESGKKVSQTDRNTLYMRGVEDTISLEPGNPVDVITAVVSEQVLQKNCSAMLDRRKVFDFESLQERPDADGTVHIKFYDITVKDSVNPDDRDLLIDIEERPSVRFDDVIGAENAKAELKDFIKYLESPTTYLQNALAVPKGILLYGPPGTGKTMLAKALAGETDATFISMSAAKLRDAGTESVERLFNTARKYAPAIIFLDEVDAIARKRTGNVNLTYQESLLNMLLTQMDGFEQHKNAPVFVVAATNFSAEITDDPMDGGLDPAFLRRFGNKILISQPNKAERVEFLSRRLSGNGKATLQNIVTASAINNVAERTPGESLAILENILELAFRNAARKGQQLDDDLLDEALEEYSYGKKRIKDEDQIYRTAVHEASHAYIYALSGKKPTYLTVISRGNFGGYMQREDEENKGTTSMEECIWDIRTSLAGRIGEMVVFQDQSSLNTGASSDLRKASAIALGMLISYGMDGEHLFSMPYDQLAHSGLMPLYVERAEAILRQQEQECRALVEQGKDKITAIARALMEKNHLNQEEIAELLHE